VMATFGAVQPSDTFAADALRALLDLGAAFETWADERQAAGEAAVRAGAAVTVGKVLFGVTGDRTRLEFTVIGSPVNLAAKVEKHSRAVGRPLLATRAALDMAVAQGFTGEADFDPLPAQRVEGTEGRIDLVAAGAWRGA
jgi:adenylate cyclase